MAGFFGDALAKEKGDCKPCQCSPVGTIQSEEGPPTCDGLTGLCACLPHVLGRNCDKCEVSSFLVIITVTMYILKLY